VETIIDDRAVSAGVVFSEADLIGAPIRLTVSPRNLADGMIELTTRDKRVKQQVPVAKALSAVLALKAQLFAEIMEK
jgi:prolyl-tRNA synthetase